MFHDDRELAWVLVDTPFDKKAATSKRSEVEKLDSSATHHSGRRVRNRGQREGKGQQGGGGGSLVRLLTETRRAAKAGDLLLSILQKRPEGVIGREVNGGGEER